MKKNANLKPSGYKPVCILLMLLLFLNGCTGVPQNVSSGNEITVALNTDTGSLDPAGSIALTYLAYSASALNELLTFNEDGSIDYRAAESYEVNGDFTEWKFHLKEDAVWSDGEPVTAYDFINTITRSLDPKSGSGYANYLFPIKNAESIYNGEASLDDLGVSSPDEFTLIFELNSPCVYFLDLLRLPVYMPSNLKHADSSGSGWDRDPNKSMSNGPFYLDEYVPEQYFVLKKNELYAKADEIKLEQITYRFFDSQQAMVAAYETEEVDIAPDLHSAVIGMYEGSPDLVITDSIATRYIYPNTDIEPLNDERVRRALTLSINREELCTIVGENTEPTVNFIAKYLKDKNGNYFVGEAKIPFTENLNEARRLLAEAGYPDGEGFPKLTYIYPALELDSDTAQVLQQQWKENLNIDLELKAQELQVNYSTRRSGDFELCRMNWTADFSDPYTYLSMLMSNSPYNCSGIYDEKYDDLILSSDEEKDIDKRSRLLHEAEKLAVWDMAYVIPLYSIKNCNLIRPEIKGIEQIAATGELEYRNAYTEK